VTSVRPAASVVLVREGGEVLWVRRGEQLRFAGGFYAFPGGRVDIQDAAVPLDGAARVGAAEAPCIVAAARELFEETGVLAVPGAADRVMAWRSRPKHRSAKPLSAVQNPSETQANRIVKRLRIASSRGSPPWYGKTLVVM